jgi:signal transduction histidine kinase
MLSVISAPQDDYTISSLGIVLGLFVLSFVEFYLLGKDHPTLQTSFDFLYLLTLFIAIIQWNEMMKIRRNIRLTDALNESWARGYFPAFSILVGGARMGSFFICANFVYVVMVYAKEEAWDCGGLLLVVLLFDELLISVALVSYHYLMQYICDQLVQSFLVVSCAKSQQSAFLAKMSSHNIRTPLNG